MITVKGQQIGTGKPKVCIPIVEETMDMIVQQVRRLKNLEVEMLEWRVDAFEKCDDLDAVREVLSLLEKEVSDMIFVFTFRSKNQGGLRELSKEQICDLHQVAAESKIVDFIDVEFFETKHVEREIYKLQKMGCRVIASHHDFFETPEKDLIQMLLNKMAESESDIVKLAVMPNSKMDVLVLLQETLEFSKRYPNTPIITMSMGEIGGISRLCGEVFGSCVTFGALEKTSAPGQFPMDDLNQILTSIHQSICSNS